MISIKRLIERSGSDAFQASLDSYRSVLNVIGEMVIWRTFVASRKRVSPRYLVLRTLAEGFGRCAMTIGQMVVTDHHAIVHQGPRAT